VLEGDLRAVEFPKKQLELLEDLWGISPSLLCTSAKEIINPIT